MQHYLLLSCRNSYAEKQHSFVTHFCHLALGDINYQRAIRDSNGMLLVNTTDIIQ